MPRGAQETSNFEFFVLKLVELGVSTAYSLTTRAGLSYGAVIPALNRLKKRKLLQAVQTGQARKRNEFSITDAGRKHLKESWPHLVRHPQSDAESLCRLAILAILMGQPRSEARELLLRGAARIADLRNREKLPEEAIGPETYRWMMARCDSHRRAGEIRALKSLADDLPKGSSAKRATSATKASGPVS
jgi:DNA-binding PadR family transcriptional regulator